MRFDLAKAGIVECLAHHRSERIGVDGFAVGRADMAIFNHAQSENSARAHLVFFEFAVACLEREGFAFVDDEVTRGTRALYLVQHLLGHFCGV